MYGVPKDIDWSFLIGKQVNQIAIGRTQTQIHLNANASISLESRFRLEGTSTAFEASATDPQECAKLAILLGLELTAVTRHDDRCLVLSFGTAFRLELFDDSTMYESIVINGHKDGVIVI